MRNCVFHHSPLFKIFPCYCLMISHNNFFLLSFGVLGMLCRMITIERAFLIAAGALQMEERELPCPGMRGAVQKLLENDRSRPGRYSIEPICIVNSDPNVTSSLTLSLWMSKKLLLSENPCLMGRGVCSPGSLLSPDPGLDGQPSLSFHTVNNSIRK